MQIITTHKGADFDAAASVLAAKLLYPKAIAVLPNSLNPNVKAFLSIHRNLFEIHAPLLVFLSTLIKSVDPDAVEQMILKLISGNQPASIQISDLMSYPVVTVSPETRMKEVYTVLREKGHMGIPLMDDGRFVGIISRRDFWRAKKTSAINAPVRAFMTRDVVTIKPGRNPMQAARLIIQHDIGRLPVVDNGRVIGIVTRSDSMRYLYDLLPE